VPSVGQPVSDPDEFWRRYGAAALLPVGLESLWDADSAWVETGTVSDPLVNQAVRR
jgi:hypothetical protein